MITYRSKTRKGSKITPSFYRLILLVVAGLCLVFVSVINIKLIQRRKIINRRIGRLEKELESLKRKRKDLLAKISELESSDFLERAGYEKFNLKKPGERVVAFPVLEDLGNASSVPSSTSDGNKAKEGIWVKIFKKLKLK